MRFSVAGRENKELNILIFTEVLENIATVDRVLTKPGGSLLLAGRSGVGRRTAVSLVAHMHSIELFTPKISRAYQLKHFKNDLKTVSIIIQLKLDYKIRLDCFIKFIIICSIHVTSKPSGNF